MKFYKSLQFKFIVITIVILLFAASLISILSTSISKNTISKTTYELLNAITDSAAGKVKGENEKQFLLLEALGRSEFLRDDTIPLSEKCSRLSAFSKIDECYENIAFYTLDGESYTAQGQYIKLEREYIKVAAEGKTYIQDPAINPVTNILFQIYSAPVYDENNKPIGCIVANILGETLTRRIENIKFGSDNSIIQVSNRKTGKTIASTNIEQVIKGESIEDGLKEEAGIGPVLKEMVAGKTGSSIFSDIRANGEAMVAAYRPVPGTDWSVLCVAPYSDFYSALRKNSQISIIILVCVTVIAGLIMFFVCRKSFMPLKKLNNAIDDIASGDADLTKRLTATSKDEIGEIVNGFNVFTGNLHSIISQISDSKKTLQSVGENLQSSSEDTSSSIIEILANIEAVHNQIVNQSDSVHQTASAVNEIASNIDSLEHMIENQSAGVTQASAAVEEMIGNIHSVNKSMEKMSSSFEELTQSAQDGSSVQERVNGKIEQISLLSQTLQEANVAIAAIAEQTNLLAMNAAIEAAHAGDAGKGFAVVADEIRKLSETSTQQSKTIGDQLTNIQTSIEEVVSASDLSRKSFDKVTSKIKDTDELVHQIRAAMEEQNEGSKQIIAALNSMNNSTMQVRSAGEEMAEGNKAILSEVKALQDATGIMQDSMSEMRIGATKINETGEALRQISTEVDNSIVQIGKEIDQFKI
ncbi:MAG: HAMP domain-containing protein [Treponema sp.]|nr:HAMP domain-containing protein [Treponema sp.]